MEAATQSGLLGGDSLRQVKGSSARSILNRSDQGVVSAGEPTVVDIEDGAVDVVRCRRGEKDRRWGDVDRIVPKTCSSEAKAQELLAQATAAPSGNASDTLEKLDNYFTMLSVRLKSGGAEYH